MTFDVLMLHRWPEGQDQDAPVYAALSSLHGQASPPRHIMLLDDSGPEFMEHLNRLGQRQRHVPVRIQPGKNLAEKLNIGMEELDQRLNMIGHAPADLILIMNTTPAQRDLLVGLEMEHTADPKTYCTPGSNEPFGLCLPRKAWRPWDERCKDGDSGMSKWLTALTRKSGLEHVFPPFTWFVQP
mgnify:FL=1